MLDIPLSPGATLSADDAVVVLLDERGRPVGTAPKASVHGPATPLHLAFSCYVVDTAGRVLLTRRAASKRTWPSTWTNACCGHPRPGETLREAVARHLRDELRAAPTELALALPDFAYRATMHDGTVEHELCPVVVATIDGAVELDPAEADAAEWVDWRVLVARARHAPATLSPWSVRQIAELDSLGGAPASWLANRRRPADRSHRPAAAVRAGLGRVAMAGRPAPAGATVGRSAVELCRPDRVAARHDDDRRPGAEVPRPRIEGDRGAADLLARAVAADPFAGELGRRLDEVVAERVVRLGLLDERADVLGHALGELIARSAKRLRPAFVHWGHLAGGGRDPGAVLDLAVAVELLHTFALVHDDVIDRSPARRGGPSVHAGFAAHATGDGAAAQWFGTSAAIVAGDLAFVWADELLDSACRGPIDAAAVREVYTTLRTEVIVGQYLDVRAGIAPHDTDPLRVALLKSGRYTVSRPLELGARAAGADADVVERLVAYGDAAGIAFQLRDDVLGVFGDERVTGKDAFGDLREGKRTLLVARALDLAAPAARRELQAHLGRADLTAADAARCREIVAASGALASVEARIAAEAAAAAEALSGIDGDAVAALESLLVALTERDA